MWKGMATGRDSHLRVYLYAMPERIFGTGKKNPDVKYEIPERVEYFVLDFFILNIKGGNKR